MSEPRRRGGQQVIPRPGVWRLGESAPWTRAGHITPTVDVIVERVARHPRDRPLAPSFPEARPSAVLIALVDGPTGAEVLLTKRSTQLRHHRGEISFPGGRLEPGESPVDAALREAREEVALDTSLVEVTGELNHLSTVVSGSYIVPLVARLSRRPRLVPHTAEVDRVLWVPVAELADPTVYREEWWGEPPLDRPVHFFELDDETVWGATGRMLHELLRRAFDVEGADPPAW